MNNRSSKFVLALSLILLIAGLVSCVGSKKGRYENCSHFSSTNTRVHNP